MLAYILDSDWAIAMGDDAVEQWTPETSTGYRMLGFRVKALVRCEKDSFSFCSNKFGSECAIPQNWAKALFRLLSSKMSDDLVDQFSYEFRHSPKLNYCLGMVDRARHALGNSTFVKQHASQSQTGR